MFLMDPPPPFPFLYLKSKMRCNRHGHISSEEHARPSTAAASVGTCDAFAGLVTEGISLWIPPPWMANEQAVGGFARVGDGKGGTQRIHRRTFTRRDCTSAFVTMTALLQSKSGLPPPLFIFLQVCFEEISSMTHCQHLQLNRTPTDSKASGHTHTVHLFLIFLNLFLLTFT